MSNDPAAHESTITPTHYSHFVLISYSHFYDLVNTGHQVNKIFSTPISTVGSAELGSVPCRTSWVGTKNGITHFSKCCNWITSSIACHTCLLKYSCWSTVNI